MRPPLLQGPPDQLLGDVPPVEAIVGGVDGLLPTTAPGQGLGLGFHQLLEHVVEIRLAEHLPRSGSGILLVLGMGEEEGPGVGPLGHGLTIGADPPHGVLLHGIALGHLHGRGEDLGQAHGSVFGQHGQESARGPGGHRRQRALFRRIPVSPLVVEIRSRSCGRDSEGIDGDDLLRVGIVDESLGLPSPAQDVPHGGGGRQHGARRIHRVSPLSEHHGPGRGGHGLPGDRHPVLAVENGLLGPLPLSAHGPGKREQEGDDDGGEGMCEGSPVEDHRSSLEF